MPAAANQTWTTRSLLKWMIDAFTRQGLDSPRLCAELLLSHVIGCERLRLYMDADRPAAPLERQSLRELVARALKDEPVQYLVGEGWFYGLPFKVDRRVLVPRPATETIIEQVLLHARAEPGFGGKEGQGVVLADVCTGSGCIAVALAKNMPKAHVVATDLAQEAVDLARENAARHGVADRVELLRGDLLEPLLAHPALGAARKLHYLLSNPPYIPDDEWSDVAPNVKDYEPASALRGGPDGLDFVRPLVERGPDLLRPGGLLLIEVAASRAEAALELARAHPHLEGERIETDFEGLPRVIVARRTP